MTIGDTGAGFIPDSILGIVRITPIIHIGIPSIMITGIMIPGIGDIHHIIAMDGMDIHIIGITIITIPIIIHHIGIIIAIVIITPDLEIADIMLLAHLEEGTITQTHIIGPIVLDLLLGPELQHKNQVFLQGLVR